MANDKKQSIITIALMEKSDGRQQSITTFQVKFDNNIDNNI